MYSNLFSPDSIAELTVAMQTQFPKAIWETFYVTLLSTALAVVIGLPLGVLLVAGEKGGVLPLPKALMSILNVIINLLRSIPFLILMIMVFPCLYLPIVVISLSNHFSDIFARVPSAASASSCS